MALTHARLKKLLSYDPASGEFTRLTIMRGYRVGSVAGTKSGHAYCRIAVDYHLFYQHRLAWFYMTGKWPKYHIDHINHNKSDNRFANLREATSSENSHNSNLAKGGSKFRGVGVRSDTPRRKRWYVRLNGNKNGNKHVADFSNEVDAAICANYHFAHLHGGFAQLNTITANQYIHD